VQAAGGAGSARIDNPDRKTGRPPIPTRGEPSTSPDVNASIIMQNMVMNDDDRVWYDELFKKQARRFLRPRSMDAPGARSSMGEGLDHTLDSYGVFIPVPVTIVRQLEMLYPSMADRAAVDDSPLHVTVLYVGKLTSEQAGRLRAICSQVLSGLKPFSVEMQGTDHFHNADSSVFHVRVNSDRLTELHHTLRSSIESAGIPVKHSYGDDGHSYTGHITLAYLPSGQTETDIPVVGSWVVDRVEVWNMSSPVSLKLGQSHCLACAAGICKNHLTEAKKELLTEPDDEAASRKKKKRSKKQEANSVGAGAIRGTIGDPVLKARKKNAKINARAFGGGKVVGKY
jgi:2'-5' RNA ligase